MSGASASSIFNPNNFFVMDKAIQKAVSDGKPQLVLVYDEIDRDMFKDLLDEIDPNVTTAIMDEDWIVARNQLVTSYLEGTGETKA